MYASGIVRGQNGQNDGEMTHVRQVRSQSERIEIMMSLIVRESRQPSPQVFVLKALYAPGTPGGVGESGLPYHRRPCADEGFLSRYGRRDPVTQSSEVGKFASTVCSIVLNISIIYDTKNVNVSTRCPYGIDVAVVRTGFGVLLQCKPRWQAIGHKEGGSVVGDRRAVNIDVRLGSIIRTVLCPKHEAVRCNFCVRFRFYQFFSSVILAHNLLYSCTRTIDHARLSIQHDQYNY